MGYQVAVTFLVLLFLDRLTRLDHVDAMTLISKLTAHVDLHVVLGSFWWSASPLPGGVDFGVNGFQIEVPCSSSPC